jgi:ATP-dependent Zn protease
MVRIPGYKRLEELPANEQTSQDGGFIREIYKKLQFVVTDCACWYNFKNIGGIVNPRNQSFLVTFLFVVALAAMVVTLVRNDSAATQPLTINELAQDIEQNRVSRVVIENDGSLRVVYKSGTEAETDPNGGIEAYKESDSTLVEQLAALGVSAENLSAENVKIEVEAPSIWSGAFGGFIAYLLPLLLMVGVFWFIFRQAQGSNNGAMSFGKSRARMAGYGRKIRIEVSRGDSDVDDDDDDHDVHEHDDHDDDDE